MLPRQRIRSPIRPSNARYLTEQVLRSLLVTANSINSLSKNQSWVAASNLLQHALASIRSPDFSWIMVTYREGNFRGTRATPGSYYPRVYEMLPAEREAEVSCHRKQFKVLREARRIRNFSLELNAAVWKPLGTYC